MGDPGFPGGINPKGGGTNLLFGQFDSENCIKVKKTRPGGACPKFLHVDLPLSGVKVCIMYG